MDMMSKITLRISSKPMVIELDVTRGQDEMTVVAGQAAWGEEAADELAQP